MKRFKAVPRKGIVASTNLGDMEVQPITKSNVLKALRGLGIDTSEHKYLVDNADHKKIRFTENGDYLAILKARFDDWMDDFEEFFTDDWGLETVGEFLDKFGRSVDEAIHNVIDTMDAADAPFYIENRDTDEVLYEE